MEKKKKPGPKPTLEAARRVKFTTNLDGQLLAKLKKRASYESRNVNQIIESLIKDYIKTGR